jgi:hypothetical protein
LTVPTLFPSQYSKSHNGQKVHSGLRHGFIRANLFSGICLFCNFVRNTIYVIEVEMLEPVFMARYP